MKNIFFKTIMLKGEAGGTISRIEKTGTSGAVDTYTIYMNDGTMHTFEVTNGSSIASIEKTATSGLQDTYTITLTNGDTSTFEVMNGEDAPSYEVPAGSVIYYDGNELPEGYENSINPDTSALADLQDKAEKASGLTWFHDTDASTVSMSGQFSAIQSWITSNFITNKWIGCKARPTDSTGYFGSSSFTILANLSSANYGMAQLMSDNSSVSVLVVGQLSGGVWSWKSVNTTAIS